jgi:hypothetical protein
MPYILYVVEMDMGQRTMTLPLRNCYSLLSNSSAKGKQEKQNTPYRLVRGYFQYEHTNAR